MNIKANFDILYLLKLSNLKYDGLSNNEINNLLYIAKLMSVYDGYNAAEWGYEFATNVHGGPFSAEIMVELSRLAEAGTILVEGTNYSYFGNEINFILKMSPFASRLKYLKTAIDILFLNSLPSVCYAMQKELNIKNNLDLKKNEILKISEENDTYKLLQSIRELYTVRTPQLITPADTLIKFLLEEE